MIDKVYVQNLSNLEVEAQGFLVFCGENLHIIYETGEDELNNEKKKILELISGRVESIVINIIKENNKTMKVSQSFVEFSNSIRKEILKYLYISGLQYKNSDKFNLVEITNNLKMYDVESKITIKLFTEQEFKRYKSNVQIFEQIKNQNQ